jgi:hypothetical protein
MRLQKNAQTDKARGKYVYCIGEHVSTLVYEFDAETSAGPVTAVGAERTSICVTSVQISVTKWRAAAPSSAVCFQSYAYFRPKDVYGTRRGFQTLYPCTGPCCYRLCQNMDTFATYRPHRTCRSLSSSQTANLHRNCKQRPSIKKIQWMTKADSRKFTVALHILLSGLILCCNVLRK